MILILCVVCLFLVADVFADNGCLLHALYSPHDQGYSVLGLNFSTQTAVLIPDFEPDTFGCGPFSKDIKLVSQKLYRASEIICSAIVNQANLQKCVEFHFEVFGAKHMVLAGVYNDSDGGYPRMYADFQRAHCQDGWKFDQNSGKFCDRDEFFFKPNPEKCAETRDSFFIQAKIPRKNCVDQLSQIIRSRDLAASIFLIGNGTLEPIRNEKNIKLVGVESWNKWKKQNVSASYCRFLNPPIVFVMCHLLHFEISGKPYLVLYGFDVYSPIINILDYDTSIQCQAGIEFNPLKLFPCNNKNDTEIVATFFKEIHNECWNDHPLIGISGPRQ